MIYNDMDGYLILYDYDMYEHHEGRPDWDTLGAHAFADGKADPFAKQVTKRLAAMMVNDMYILTTICSHDNPDIRNEQIFDKMNTIIREYPFLNLCNFITCESDKRNAISKFKGMKLTKSDILIDDYKKNLAAWRNAGGTAIKYINGINSVGDWPGPYIDSTTMTVDQAVNTILKAWYDNC